MQKEMSEEVKAFKANVSNIFGLNLNMGAHRETGRNVKANVHVIRHIIFV